MEAIQVGIIPGFRISTHIKPDVRIYSEHAVELILNAKQENKVVKSLEYKLGKDKRIHSISPDFSGIKGDITLEFYFYNINGKLIENKNFKYEIIDSSCNSTTLLDGCWVSIYHWSEDEARWFNKDLARLLEKDWKEQIYAMNRAGINGVIVQSVFECNEYAGKHNMTLEGYKGRAFYPSRIYGERCPVKAEDPVEAILSAADEVNMNVFLGVGNFAWFDFSPQSLEWHKNITLELFEMYGHHPSLYGWYISEEMFGSLYYDWDPVEDEKYRDIVDFFREYKDFVRQLTPVKPVALAPNNIRFHEYEKEWKEILANVDILLPFAFARDLENLNIDEIARICEAAGTHFWVDMEMFAWPLDNGLVPKTIGELIKEIRIYDKLEQIYGYQFTGIMNHPGNKYDLGGEPAKNLYREYCKYYDRIKSMK